MGIELCQLDHRENYEYLYKILFIFLGGHQSVRDRTAQAGTPILKFTSIYTNMKCWESGVPNGQAAYRDALPNDSAHSKNSKTF